MGNAHRRRWTDGELTAGSFLLPHRAARAVFHPAWIPDSLDPTVERLKRARVAVGFVAALGVHVFFEIRFSWDELPRNAAIAALVLFCVTPLATGAMLLVWRRGGTVRRLRARLLDTVKLLSLFTASAFVCLALFAVGDMVGTLPKIALTGLGLWTALFVIAGGVRLTGNFFGTGAVHRCLPPLLATVTSWVLALSDLAGSGEHGMDNALGVTCILAAPVTVTAIALLETHRLKKRYGIRLMAHPALLAPAHNGRNPYGA
ncbi:hypothetical protein [Streptomyces sp. NBC_00582]|uniref:hypothetical protein n=1 Tax=Streptomyces sp. NBC_00582 TaxID=2975783 RepID=UPI002E818512|nr:hypothetical protein [Streptomyces sp. NBC_00582]WUB65522.1 hypothetical protein OG852_36450 [Streptomyces sp. NBC_00582]